MWGVSVSGPADIMLKSAERMRRGRTSLEVGRSTFMLCLLDVEFDANFVSKESRWELEIDHC
jgi:hypothetical protein